MDVDYLINDHVDIVKPEAEAMGRSEEGSPIRNVSIHNCTYNTMHF